MIHLKKIRGFTLAELLIALAALGVISTFTIPKLLQSNQNTQFNAEAKEAMGIISAAYQQMKLKGLVSSSTVPGDIIPYVNYAKQLNPALFIDPAPNNGGAPVTCSAPCYLLHHGGVLRIGACSFSGTSPLHKISYQFDPDGQLTGRNDSVYFNLYYDGRVTTAGAAPAGSISSCSGPTGAPDPTQDPSWLSF